MLEFIQKTDVNVLLFIQENLRIDFLTPFVKLITRLGDKGAIWIILSLFFVFVIKNKKAGYSAAISLIGSAVINNLIIKNVVARQRPFDAIEKIVPLIEKPTDFSFPSGHTAASFAVAFAVYGYLPKKYGVLLIVLSVLIGLSRMYLGVHYPSDVLFGALSGFVISRVAVFLVKKFKI